MFTVNWKKGINDNNTKIQQLSDRFIFLLCFYCAKRNFKTRNALEGNLNFTQYIDFYKNNNKLSPTITETEPYKSILKKLNDDEIPDELKIQIYDEYKKYVHIPFSTKKCIYETLLVCNIIILLFAIIDFLFSLTTFLKDIHNKTPSQIIFIILFTLMWFGLIIFLIFFLLLTIRKIKVSKDPKRNITLLLNSLIFDKTCINTLNIICESIPESHTILNNIAENEQRTSKSNSQKRKTGKKKEYYSKFSREELVKEFYETFKGTPKNLLQILSSNPYNGKMTLTPDYKLIGNINLLINYLDDKSAAPNYPLLEVLFNKKNLRSYCYKNYNPELVREFTKFIEKHK